VTIFARAETLGSEIVMWSFPIVQLTDRRSAAWVFDQIAIYKDRAARPVRCNGWISRLSCKREYVLPSVENRRLRTERDRLRPSCALVLPRCTRRRCNLTAARCLDCSDVDFFHLHHRIERALGGSGIGTGDRLWQGDRRNLPGQSPFVLTPAARALLAAVADDRVQ
jgi:hypothetical protein